jgi:hypothetical protein
MTPVTAFEALTELAQSLGGFVAGGAAVIIYAQATGQALKWPWSKKGRKNSEWPPAPLR